jgi:6-phosphogluconolactonase (cycloisomerase 2 family)
MSLAQKFTKFGGGFSLPSPTSGLQALTLSNLRKCRKDSDASKAIFSKATRSFILGSGCRSRLSSPRLNAEDTQGNNFVYVMTNNNPLNSVIQFRRASDGSLSWVREVPTGGSGTGPTGVDPLGSQDSLVLSGDGHFLLAVNPGSNELSLLAVEKDKLILRDRVWSGGDFPNSVALSGDLVYVLNAKGATPHIKGFRLDPEGSLQAISAAQVDLPPGSGGANDIRFTEDGTRLLVTVSVPNQILVFEVGDNGIAETPASARSAGASPFGIRLGRNGIVIVSEAAGSAS